MTPPLPQVRRKGRSEKRLHPPLQQPHQFRLHEGVVVGDVEGQMTAGALQMRPEAALQPGVVGALHDEDDVGPVQQVRRDRLDRVGGQAGGAVSTPGRSAKTRSTAREQANAGADEVEAGQSRRLHDGEQAK